VPERVDLHLQALAELCEVVERRLEEGDGAARVPCG
jgi:hypothetical protein